MSVQSEAQAARSLIRQLQGALGGKRVVDGTVGSGGTVDAGVGWTVVRNATGDYTVTFTTAFAEAPRMTYGVIGSTIIVRTESKSVSSVNILTRSLANAAANATFDFHATAP